MVRRLLLHLVRDAGEADDLTQEVFVSLLRQQSAPQAGFEAARASTSTHSVGNAIAQFGAERVARYLGCANYEIEGAHHIQQQLGGSARKEEASGVFSRFLDYLRYVELDASTEPRPEMAWFITG